MTAVAVLHVLLSPVVSVARAQSLELNAVADARARDAIRLVINDAKQKGVPEALLIAKVREGVAKQSEPDRIHSAVRTLADRLERAQRALSPVQALDELAAGAGALQMKVPEAMLRTMRRTWPDRPLTVPLGVLTELVANDIPAKSAAERVHALMERGASSAQIVALGDTVRADIAAGRAPDASMELRTKGILSLLPNASGATTTTGQTLDTRARRPVRPPGR
jgi:hypothetical protein